MITTEAELEALYDKATSRSIAKQTTALTPAMQSWLKHSPFLILATIGEIGLDCSPRGDALEQGFKIIDQHTIAIPDRKGNNRLDSLRNVLRDPRVGLVFLVPGADEALRVQGTAIVSDDPELLETLALAGKTPSTAILVTIKRVFIQNARAIRRANLWPEVPHTRPADLPPAELLHET